MKRFPRILLAAPGSGSGKTWITCGILQAFINNGKKTASFKCGPDYIDPMFHSKIIGAVSKNIDSFFTEEKITKYLFCKAAKEADISVIEGVMGYYDGIAGTEIGSAYELAGITQTPVILIVNCKGMGGSIAALIKGFAAYRENSGIKGVILNQISPPLYPEMKKKIEEELFIHVYGYVPTIEKYKIESRHLGLVLPTEIEDLKQNVKGLSSILEETLELENISALAESASCLTYEEPEIPTAGDKLTIGVAKDEVFCFIYKDNLELLEKMGAKLVYFSPLHDKTLPKNLDGLLFYGGYPELYAKKLSENSSLRAEIKRKIKEKIPYMAECGGFMYLHDSLEDENGISYPMTGVIGGKCFKTEKLQRFGYVELSTQEDKIFDKELNNVKGHEFHYYNSTNNGTVCAAKKPFRNRRWECMHGDYKSLAGFPHLYYYSDITIPYGFLQACAAYQRRRK